MRKINIISRCQAQYRGDKVKAEGITPCHHSYIFAISKNPGISQDELAKDICVNKSNVTRSLAQLEQQGYIRRCQSDSDQRVTKVYPTEKMEELLPLVHTSAREWNRYLTEGIRDSDMEIFQSVLETMTERAKNYLEKGGADNE